MAVALRAYTQGTTQAGGEVDIAWPTGTAAGDLAILVAQDYRTNGPQTTGWGYYGAGVWAKRVTSTDIADDLPVKGRTTFLQTFTGAAKIGKVRWSYGMTLSVAGAGLFVDGWGPARVTTIDPGATDRLGDQIRLVTDDTPNAVWFVAASAAEYTALDDHDHACTYVAYEILPTEGPNAPLPLTPLPDAQVDTDEDVPFTWAHQSTSDDSQTGFKLRIRDVGGSTWSYVQSDGTLTTSETAVTSGTQGTSIDTGELVTDQEYEWQVATAEDTSWSDYSTLQTVTPVEKPTVDSITVTAVLDDLSPTIAWTLTAGVGSQEAWQVRVCDSGDSDPSMPLWDSNVVQGSSLSTDAPTTVEWTNGQDLYAWVRVQQTGNPGLWSDWTKDDATFEVTWTPPSDPTSVVCATTGSPQRITVNSSPLGDRVQVRKSEFGEDPVLIADEYAGGTSMYVYDPMQKYNGSTLYQARNIDLVDGVWVASDWTNSSSRTGTDTGAFLVAADDYQDYLAVTIKEDGARTRVQGTSVMYGLGAERPRVDRAVYAGQTGTTTFQTETVVQREQLVAFLSNHDQFYLRWNPETQDGDLVDVEPTLVALAGESTVDRLAQLAIGWRTVTITWVEQ